MRNERRTFRQFRREQRPFRTAQLSLRGSCSGGACLGQVGARPVDRAELPPGASERRAQMRKLMGAPIPGLQAFGRTTDIVSRILSQGQNELSIMIYGPDLPVAHWYTREEIFELARAVGFRVGAWEQTPLPHFVSPLTGRGLIENVLTFEATRA